LPEEMLKKSHNVPEITMSTLLCPLLVAEVFVAKRGGGRSGEEQELSGRSGSRRRSRSAELGQEDT
jgi:hypothetical protein